MPVGKVRSLLKSRAPEWGFTFVASDLTSKDKKDWPGTSTLGSLRTLVKYVGKMFFLRC